MRVQRSRGYYLRAVTIRERSLFKGIWQLHYNFMKVLNNQAQPRKQKVSDDFVHKTKTNMLGRIPTLDTENMAQL